MDVGLVLRGLVVMGGSLGSWIECGNRLMGDFVGSRVEYWKAFIRYNHKRYRWESFDSKVM